jgi:hypothetical protein
MQEMISWQSGDSIACSAQGFNLILWLASWLGFAFSGCRTPL